MVSPSVGKQRTAPVPDGVLPERAALLQRLAAVVVLSGSVRAQPWVRSLSISPLDLPIDDSQRFLDCWVQDIESLRGVIGLDRLPARVVIDKTSVAPAMPDAVNGESCTIERDPNDLRGTGGVLKDLASRYEPDRYLLVVNGVQLMLESLSELAVELAMANEHVSLVAHRDGMPSGVMLVRCGVFDIVTSPGFIDMKEQVLPLVAREFGVGLVQRDEPSGLSVRTLADYLGALRAHHRRLSNSADVLDPYAENLSSTFAIVQDGATVDPTAHIHDSVVLAGARVGPRATVVRSVVASGGVVHANQRVVGRLVRAAGSGRGAQEASS